jgi:hypothetical protein
MNFTCVLPCNGAFSSRAGLTCHQNTCSAFQTSQELKLENRRVTAARSKLNRDKTRTSAAPYSKKPDRDSNAELSGSNVNPNLQTLDQHIRPANVSINTHSSVLPGRPSESYPPLSDPMPPPQPPVTPSGFGGRQPRRFDDRLPDQPAPIPVDPHLPAPPIIRRVILHVRDFFRSAMNRFHVLREYHHRPSYDPDTHIKPEDLANFRLKEPPHSDNSFTSKAVTPPPPWPFDKMSKYLIMNWFHSGGHQKSEGEVNRLIKEVLTTSGFSPADLADFTIRQGNKTLDKAYAGNETPFSKDDWQELSVDIEVPVPLKNSTPRMFRVPGLYRRSIIDVIKNTWESLSSRQFHLTPFKRIHIHPSTGKETRIYDEAYTSDAWIEAHDELQKQPNEPGCKLEKVITGLMFWSDSTHLTNFGTASVWPLYMYFGNLSKYVRARPNSGACHHIAYLPYVSLDYC